MFVNKLPLVVVLKDVSGDKRLGGFISFEAQIKVANIP